MRTSTHTFAHALLHQPEGALRGLKFGRFVLLWDGQKGDYREAVSTDEFFSSKDRA